MVQAPAGPIPELDCVIQPSEVVDVGSAVPGVVLAFHAFRSDLVEKGAIIVELESSVEQAALDLAKTRAALNTGIELRQQSATLGHLTQKRNQELLKTSAISMQEMDKLKAETRIAELQVRQEKDNKRIAGLEYKRAKAILQRRTIRSPVDGVVMERFKSPGEYVEDEPMLRVAQLDPLHVEVIVPVDYLGRITPGMQALVTPTVAGSEKHLATVERVDLVSDAASGTYGVRLSLSNPINKIPAGLRCRLSFLQPKQQDFPEIASEPDSLATETMDEDVRADEVFEPELVQQPDAPGIEPAAEMAEPEPEPVAETTEPEPEPAAGPAFCYTVGPVADETLATKLFDRLEARSDALVLRNETVHVDNGYLILAAPEPDRQATRALIARLDKVGITDHLVLGRGGNKGRVALGVYNGPRTAARRQKALAAKGFETEMITRRKKTTQFWLDGSAQTGTDLPDQAQEITASMSPSASFRQITCPQQLAYR